MGAGDDQPSRPRLAGCPGLAAPQTLRRTAHRLHRLLLRLVDVRTQGDVTPEMESYRVAEDRGKPVMGRRVLITAATAEPMFKILLWPFRSHEDLPRTTWEQSGTHLNVHYEGVEDHFLFQPHADGRTRVTLRHDGRVILGEDERDAPQMRR